MVLKINRLSDKTIKDRIKLWNIAYIFFVFMLSLIFLSAVISDYYVMLVLMLSSLPLVFMIVLAKQESNYLKLLLEIRKNDKEDE